RWVSRVVEYRLPLLGCEHLHVDTAGVRHVHNVQVGVAVGTTHCIDGRLQRERPRGGARVVRLMLAAHDGTARTSEIDRVERRRAPRAPNIGRHWLRRYVRSRVRRAPRYPRSRSSRWALIRQSDPAKTAVRLRSTRRGGTTMRLTARATYETGPGTP